MLQPIRGRAGRGPDVGPGRVAEHLLPPALAHDRGQLAQRGKRVAGGADEGGVLLVRHLARADPEGVEGDGMERARVFPRRRPFRSCPPEPGRGWARVETERRRRELGR
jgi:hypothetical protein